LSREDCVVGSIGGNVLTARKYMKRLALGALVCGVLFMCAVGGWLLAGQRPYPRQVQFRAPHRGTLAATIDAIWFRPDSPRIFEFLPESWIPVVYAQQCSTHICNGYAGYETNAACAGCGAGWYNQLCTIVTYNSWCEQNNTTCPGGGICIRATSTTKCNPPN
jgi:hypothetical protein